MSVTQAARDLHVMLDRETVLYELQQQLTISYSSNRNLIFTKNKQCIIAFFMAYLPESESFLCILFNRNNSHRCRHSNREVRDIQVCLKFWLWCTRTGQQVYLPV